MINTTHNQTESFLLRIISYLQQLKRICCILIQTLIFCRGYNICKKTQGTNSELGLPVVIYFDRESSAAAPGNSKIMQLQCMYRLMFLEWQDQWQDQCQINLDI